MTVCKKYPRELTHYNRRLMKKGFSKLRNNVWETKTKLQLLTKADWNYRFKLLSFCFHLWARFSLRRLKKRKDLKKATDHYATKTKYKALAILKQTSERRWILMKNFRNKLEQKLIQKTWICWMEYVKRRLYLKRIIFLTSKKRKIYLIRFCIASWMKNYRLKLLAQKKCVEATSRYNTRLKRRVIVSWQAFLCEQRAEKNFAREMERKIKFRVFHGLMHYTLQKKLYRNHVRGIIFFYENYLIRNALDKWSLKLENLVESRISDKICRAESYYKARLTMKTFGNLKMWAREKRKRISAAKTLNGMVATAKIKYYIELWRKSFQESLYSKSLDSKATFWREKQVKKIYLEKLREKLKERETEKEKMNAFFTFCNDRLKEGVIKRWRAYVSARRRKKDKHQAAENYYNMKVMGRMVHKWRSYYLWKIKKKNANKHYDKRLMLNTLNNFRCFYALSLFYRDQTSAFRARQERKVLRNVVFAFKLIRENALQKMRKASNFADRKTKQKVFQQWMHYHNYKKQSSDLCQRNRSLLQNLIIQCILSIWLKNTKNKILFNERLKTVSRNRDIRLAKTYFKKWSNLIKKFRKIEESLLVFESLHSEIIVRNHFLRLVNTWEGRIMAKKKHDLALRAEKEIIMRGYFRKWIVFIRWKKETLKRILKKSLKSIPPQDKENLVVSKSKRKQPAIPHYLRDELTWPLPKGSSHRDRCHLGTNLTYETHLKKNVLH